MRRGRLGVAVVVGLATLAALSGTSAVAGSSSPRDPTAPVAGAPASAAPKTGYVVYWDQNEEEDYVASATNTQGQLITPWDPNGQMCLLNDGTGRSVVGYDPTQLSQHNPGGPPHHPFKQPPIGEELIARNGAWTGKNLYVPGPFKLTASGPGGDTPPVKGVYNGQSTFTGCAVDAQHNVFATDLGSAQGAFPTPTDGRLVEWFAPNYTQACILYGPTTGGVGLHHVNGTGGFAQPGMMATLPNSDLLLPQGGSATGGLPGNVFEFDHSSFPRRASQCPGGVYPRAQIKDSVFFQGSLNLLPVPQGVAMDSSCGCVAISSIFGNPSVAWFDTSGQQRSDRPPVAGETLDQFGHSDTGFNPFGLAFAPDGTLYLADIHISCTGAGLGNCGPQNGRGRVLRITFQADHQANPPQVVAGGFSFPTSTTVCVIGHGQICPFPTRATPPPNSAAGTASAG
jgi:hypothetical protein